MKQRLEQFLAAENVSRAQFADKIGMARAGITHIMSGRNNPSYEFIVNTMEAYPKLNIEWLLRGKGKMYKDDSGTSERSPISSITLNNEEKLPARQSFDTDNSPIVGTFISSRRRIIVLNEDGTYEEFAKFAE